ncbi:MAG: hypothetical protein ISR69_00075 [Gammaproteobacteria bacterium]|nr:hypothetical protein [Gammaproteobacteria bacterium]
MNKTKLLQVILVVSTLSACVSNGGSSSSSLKPVAKSGSSTGMAAVKKDKQLVMPVFRINFMKKFDAHARQKSGSWTSNASVSSHAFVETKGFDEAVFQQITDAAYEDLYKRLNDKNLNVMSLEQAKNQSNTLAKQSATQKFPEIDDDESSYLAINTMYPSGFTSTSGGKLTKAPDEVFKELKAGVIAVTYTVDFVASKAETDRVSGWSSEQMSASVEINPAASVNGLIQFFGYAEGGCAPIGGCYGPKSEARMTQRAISPIQFGKIENVTSTAFKVVEGAVNLLGMFAGSSTSSAESYELNVDEKAMVEAVTDALKKANQQLVTQL